MLQKRRDLGSIPDGLGVTASEIRKGTAVTRKFVDGVYTYAKPAAETDEIYGFITLRIDDNDHADSHYDTIPAGKKAVVYTLVKNNEWATTEFDGELAVGDKCNVSYSGETAGKLVKAVAAAATTVAEGDGDGDGDSTATTTPAEVDGLFEVVGVTAAMAGYEEAMVIVKVLK